MHQFVDRSPENRNRNGPIAETPHACPVCQRKLLKKGPISHSPSHFAFSFSLLQSANSPFQTLSVHQPTTSAPWRRRRGSWSAASSLRSSSVSRRTSPSASSARPSSASHGSAPSLTLPSSAATAPSTEPLLSSASSTRTRKSTGAGLSASSPPEQCPPSLFRRPTPVVGCPSTAATAASSSAWLKTERVNYLICDPVTGVRYRLPQLEVRYICNASAVFCAAAGCKHLDCHDGPFCVVLMIGDCSTNSMLATFYSSEIGAWSEEATWQGIGARQLYGRGALIGDEIYFMLSGNSGIIKYDWGKNCLFLVNPPPSAVYNNRVTLMMMEECSLGLAGIEHSSLYLWSRRVSSEETAEWVQFRVIDLDTMMPMPNPSDGASVFGFAEGVDVIFVRTLVGLFMMELKSGRVRKVHKIDPGLSVLPYMGFYTPDRSRLSYLGGPTVL